MCLHLDNYRRYGEISTVEFDSDGWATFFKVYKFDKDGLRSYYMNDYVTTFPVVSNRDSTQLTEDEIDDNQVWLGIHVLIDISATLDYESDNVIILPVRCHKDDLVAIGWFHNFKSAVFHKIYL